MENDSSAVLLDDVDYFQAYKYLLLPDHVSQLSIWVAEVVKQTASKVSKAAGGKSSASGSSCAVVDASPKKRNAKARQLVSSSKKGKVEPDDATVCTNRSSILAFFSS